MINPILDYHTFLSVCGVYDIDINALLLEKFKILRNHFHENIDKEGKKKSKNNNDACKDCFDMGKASKSDRSYCERRKCVWYDKDK